MGTHTQSWKSKKCGKPKAPSVLRSWIWSELSIQSRKKVLLQTDQNRTTGICSGCLIVQRSLKIMNECMNMWSSFDVTVQNEAKGWQSILWWFHEFFAHVFNKKDMKKIVKKFFKNGIDANPCLLTQICAGVKQFMENEMMMNLVLKIPSESFP